MTQEVDSLPDDLTDPSDAMDRELLVSWSTGISRAGDQLTVKYFDSIRDYFARRAPEEHEELVQSTFLQLARSKARYRGKSTVRVFIYAIARNVLRQHLRTLRRRPDFDPYMSSLFEAYGRHPSSILSEEEDHRLLLRALQEIPSAAQDLLELRYWRELTGPELRDLFEIPEGTVRGRLRAALQQLRDKFEEISERPRTISEKQVERWMGEVKSQLA